MTTNDQIKKQNPDTSQDTIITGLREKIMGYEALLTDRNRIINKLNALVAKDHEIILKLIDRALED